MTQAGITEESQYDMTQRVEVITSLVTNENKLYKC